MASSSDPMNKVLVIDDECGPRESLRILLKKDYEVHCADTVNRGIELLREKKPDAVILDLRMPGKSGLDGLREIREIDPYVSVIMLTGFGALETAQEALRLGANDYLKKPFDAMNMQATIRHSVKRSQLLRMRADTTKHLEDANAKLVQELDQKQHMAFLGQASAEFVHDLRNPMTAVLGYVELLADHLQQCKGSSCMRCREPLSYLEVIENDLRRCRDLLDMWQSIGRKAVDNMKPVSVCKLLQEIVRGVEPLAVKAGARLDYEFGAEDFEVMADNVQVYRAVNNILVNALHAVSEKKGRVRLLCRRQNDSVVICVEDNGCGISSDNLKKIFDPYFTTKQPGKGTGLGLYIARKVVEDHRGSISVHSQSEMGTSVNIHLPLHNAAALDDSFPSWDTQP